MWVVFGHSIASPLAEHERGGATVYAAARRLVVRVGRSGLRAAGIFAACTLYLFTGMPSCAGHAGYFRERLMRGAECEGTQLDLLVSAMAVAIAWLAIRPRGKNASVVLLSLLAFLFLAMPACAAMVNCGAR